MKLVRADSTSFRFGDGSLAPVVTGLAPSFSVVTSESPSTEKRRIRPSGSPVEETKPSFSSAMYSLSSLRKSPDFLVILPERRMRRPVAKGSKVPVWPTLTLWPNSSRSFARTLATTPKLLIPAGLSTKIIWSSSIF